MIQRAIVCLLLFGAALFLPATLVAAGHGNWLLAIAYGSMALMLLAAAVVYAALVVGDNADDSARRRNA